MVSRCSAKASAFLFALAVGCGARSLSDSTGPCASNYGPSWALAVHGGYSFGLAVDSKGNIAYAAPPDATNSSQIVSRDAAGALRWQTAPLSSVGGALAALDDGSLIAVGGATVTKLDPVGRVAWTQSLSATDGTLQTSFVAADKSGAVWMLGNEMAPESVPNSLTMLAPFLARLAPDGSVLWQETLGDLTVTPPGTGGLVLTAAGQAVVGLTLRGPFAVAGKQFDGLGTSGSILVTFDENGIAQSASPVAETEADTVAVLAIADDQTIYAGGNTFYSTLGQANTQLVFVAAVSSEGTVLWRQRYSQDGNARNPLIAARSCGGVVLVADFTGDTNRGTVLLRLDPSGNEQGRELMTGRDMNDFVFPMGLAPHGADGTALLANFRGVTTVVSTQLSTNASESFGAMFLARLGD